MGHGLTAAVFTAEIRFILWAFLREHEQPGLVPNQLNNYLCQSHRLFREGLNDEGDEAPVCLIVAALDAATGEGSLAVACMEPPLFVRAEGQIEEATASGLLLGVKGNQDYQAVAFHLDPGDVLLMTTDGITEARTGKEQIGSQGLRRLVEGTKLLDTLEQKAQFIIKGTREFSGGKLRDDVCLIMARRQ